MHKRNHPQCVPYLDMGQTEYWQYYASLTNLTNCKSTFHPFGQKFEESGVIMVQ